MKDSDSTTNLSVVPIDIVERRIYLIRGEKVMLDSDLADLYGVPTKALNQAVKRNLDRFPEDFMFRLSRDELDNWRSQFVTSNSDSHMGLRRPPYAFTELGLAMLSSVLNSKSAIQVNIVIMRAFVRLRETLATHKDLAARMEKLESTQQKHTSIITLLADEIDQLKELPPEPPREHLGFSTD